MAVYNIYFSPTGGTKKVSDTVALFLSENKNDIDLMEKKDFGQHFSCDDVCVISVPAYGGRVPANALEKIKSFKSNEAKAIIIAVFGNRAIDDTLIELYDIVVSLGFNVIAGIEAVAEHSLARVYAIGRPNNDDKLELKMFAEQIKGKIYCKEFSEINIPGNRPYKEFKASAMSLIVEESCVNCKKCALECPVDAIALNNIRTVDTEKCFSCMHCVFICPQNARNNSKELTKKIEERLHDVCTQKKKNRLYI